MLKKLLIIASLFHSLNILAFNVGFNQAWFKNDYAHQYLDTHYDQHEIERIFDLAKVANVNQVRLWFFESANLPMIEFSENHKIIKLKHEYIKNVIQMLEIAKLKNVKIYMTFFDAHSYRPDKLSCDENKKFKSFFQEEGSKDFLQKVIHPLFNEITKNNLAEYISRIDLVNEGDTLVNRFIFKNKWLGTSKFICQWKNYIKSIEGFKKTPVSFSIRLHPLLPLPSNLLAHDGPLKCADYFDFHSYQDSGEIYLCHELKNYSKLRKKELILGEFGQSYFTHKYDNELQIQNTRNYIKNAIRCGFNEALAWRLSDIREGHNKEARYSFEAFGQPRPAFYLIQQQNRK